MRTYLENYRNVLIRTLLHVSSLTDPPSRSVQLYKTNVQPFYHPQYVDLSQGFQCMTIEMDKFEVVGAACRFECVHGIKVRKVGRMTGITHLGYVLE
jgi:hypothetical protein